MDAVSLSAFSSSFSIPTHKTSWWYFPNTHVNVCPSWPVQQHMASQVPRTQAQEQRSDSVSSSSLPQPSSLTAASFQTDVYLNLLLENFQWYQHYRLPGHLLHCWKPQIRSRVTAADKIICARLAWPQINCLLLWTKQTLNVWSF